MFVRVRRCMVLLLAILLVVILGIILTGIIRLVRQLWDGFFSGQVGSVWHFLVSRPMGVELGKSLPHPLRNKLPSRTS